MPPKQMAKQSKPGGGGGGGGAGGGGGSNSIGSSKSGPTWTAPKNITHPEHHHTLNHLHQVALYYAVLSASSPHAAWSDTASRLQGEMVRSARTLSRKAVIRMDTGVKRDACPRCDAVLVQGLTASVTSRRSGPHDHVVKARCAVCGVVARRPAPDLVPAWEMQDPTEGAEAAKQGEGEAEGGEAMKRQRDEAEAEAAPERKKVSQRHRRRTASIKRQLLQAAQSASTAPSGWTILVNPRTTSDTTQHTASEKLSRKQKAQQRQARMAARASSSTVGPVAAPRRRRRQRAEKPLRWNDSPRMDDWTTSLSSPYYATSVQSPLDATSSAQTETLAPLHAPPQQPKPNGRRAPRPHLAHFNERLQGSHWDDPLHRLSQLLDQPPPNPASSSPDTIQADASLLYRGGNEYASQALRFWQTAARSRGDHRLVSGVGKNGALGPTLS